MAKRRKAKKYKNVRSRRGKYVCKNARRRAKYAASKGMKLFRCSKCGGTQLRTSSAYPRGLTEKTAKSIGWKKSGSKWVCPRHGAGWSRMLAARRRRNPKPDLDRHSLDIIGSGKSPYTPLEEKLHMAMYASKKAGKRSVTVQNLTPRQIESALLYLRGMPDFIESGEIGRGREHRYWALGVGWSLELELTKRPLDWLEGKERQDYIKFKAGTKKNPKQAYVLRRNPIYRSMKMKTLEDRIKALKEMHGKDKQLLKLKLFNLGLKLPPSSILQKRVAEEMRNLHPKTGNPKPPKLGTVWVFGVRIKIIKGDRWKTVGSAMDTPAAINAEVQKLKKQGYKNFWVFDSFGDKKLLSDNPKGRK